MGYETKAYIVQASMNTPVSEFVEYDGVWVHAWRNFDNNGKLSELYHYTKTGNDKTLLPLYTDQPLQLNVSIAV